QCRFLAARYRLYRDFGDRRRDRDRGGDAEDAPAGHVARQDADLRLGDADLRRHDHDRLSGGHPRHDASRNRAVLRLALLHRRKGRRSASMAASFLVLRSSGGLHHLPSGGGTRLYDGAHDGAPPAGGLPADRGGADRHRLLLLRPVGAPHVHHGHSLAQPRLLFSRQHGGSRAFRNPGLLLDRHDGRRQAALPYHHAVPLHPRLSLIFTVGGVTGVMVALVPVDFQVHDTYFVVAHFHYVLIGGVVFPLFATFYYWTPMVSRNMLSETLGRWVFWLMFVGFNVSFFPMHITGL